MGKLHTSITLSGITKEQKCFTKKCEGKENKLCHGLYQFDLCVPPTLAEEMPVDCTKRVTWDSPDSEFSFWTILFVGRVDIATKTRVNDRIMSYPAFDKFPFYNWIKYQLRGF